MSNLSTLPKGDSAWLLRKAIERIIEQISVLETNIGSSTTGNSLNGQIIFNDNGTLRGDTGLTYTKATTTLRAGLLIVPGNTQLATVGTLYVGSLGAPKLKVDVAGTGITTITEATITGDLNVTGNGFFTGTGFVALQRPLIPVGENGATSLDFRWYSTGTTYTTGARVNSSSDAAWTASSTPARLMFSTVPSGSTALVERYRIDNTGVSTWSVGGSTAMTLNSTGLGVGVSPAAGDGSGVFKAYGIGSFTANSRVGLDVRELVSGNSAGIILGAMTTENTGVIGARTGSGNIAFQTYNGSAWGERMRIDYLGNVGIGVTPSAWRNTQRALQIGAVGGLFSSAASTGSTCVGRNVYESAAGDFTYIVNDEATFYEQTATGTHAWYTAAAGTGIISFGSAKMTLDASGNLLCGSTTNTNSSRVFIRSGSAAAPTLAIQGITGDINQAGLIVGKFDNDSTTAQVLVRFTINNNAGGSGQINANGASQAAFGSYSDSRLKENILSLPSQLANILSLRPVEFDYKDGSGHQIGFVAQEMQEVYSDAVGEQNGFLTVTGWSKTEARLVSAIKELAAKVQALEAKLA